MHDGIVQGLLLRVRMLTRSFSGGWNGPPGRVTRRRNQRLTDRTSIFLLAGFFQGTGVCVEGGDEDHDKGGEKIDEGRGEQNSTEIVIEGLSHHHQELGPWL